MANEVKTVHTADVEKAIQGLQRVTQKQQEVINKLRDTDKQGKKSGDSLVKSAAGIAASYISVSAAIGAAKQAFLDFKQVREEAAKGIAGREQTLKNLLSISGGDPQEFARLKNLAKELTPAGMRLVDAEAATFKAGSVGFTDDELRRAAEFKSFVTDIEAVMGSISGLRASFPEGTKGLGIDQLMSQLLIAAKVSEVNPVELAQNLRTPAQSLKLAGATSEETQAALSVTSLALKSVDEAATAIGRLGDQFEKDPRFKGQTLTESLKELAALPDTARDAFLRQSVRAKKAGALLIGEEKFAEFRDVVERLEAARTIGGSKSMVARTIAVGLADPELAALRQQQASSAGLDVIRQSKFGTDELSREAVLAIVRQRLEEHDRGIGTRFLDEAFLKTAATFDASAETLSRQGAKLIISAASAPGEQNRLPAGSSVESVQAEIMEQMRAFVNVQTRAAELQLEAASALHEATGNRKRVQQLTNAGGE